MSSKDKLVFNIENKKTAKVIYSFDITLLNYQKDVVKNENVSLFYVLKDAANEAEEKCLNKLSLGKNEEDTILKVLFEDVILYDCDFDVPGIIDGDMMKNEVELYFIFDKISKNVLNTLSELHKDIVLSNPDSSL